MNLIEVLTIFFPFSLSFLAGITQEQIDELREKSPNQMLDDMKTLYEDGGDLEYKDEVGATPVRNYS